MWFVVVVAINDLELQLYRLQEPRVYDFIAK